MKAGFIGLIGAPNAGKSSFVNHLIGERVSAVTDKPQTTRKNVIGILNYDDGQMLFTDAPGKLHSSKGLNHYLHSQFTKALEKSDVLAAVLNIDEEEKDRLQDVVEIVKKQNKPWFALITKCDLPHGNRILALRSMLEEMNVPVITYSNREDAKDLRTEVIEAIGKLLPDSPAELMHEDLYTTQTEREIVEETIREKCFETLYEEVPYHLAVKVIKFDESREDLLRIYAEIYLSRENYRPMVVGKQGAGIKKIGTESRLALEKVLGTRIYLDLVVKIKKDWQMDPNAMKEFGYAAEDGK